MTDPIAGGGASAAAPFVLFDRGPGDAPTLFESPDRVIEAWSAGEVAAALVAVEAALAEGRWIAGAASYELGYVLEPALTALLPPRRRAPLLRFGVFGAPQSAEAMLRRAEKESAQAALLSLEPVWPRAAYDAAFAEAMEQIRAGGFYQINLTHPLSIRARGAALGLYGALRRSQPAPFGALDALGAPALLSRSPELFIETDGDGRIETRPMKGTAPRGATPAKDEALKQALGRDEKNRAENLMIVDLLRNDLGRIAEIGSVTVPELFKVETYATVHQMISRVEARLSDGAGLRRIFGALFPCGSITGAPKIAAMQAIRRLEPASRDFYCGAVGWIAPQERPGAWPRMRFNVAIRTLSLHPSQENGDADWSGVLNVGGGIVADSRLDGEYEETLWKARFATAILKETAQTS